MLTADDVYGVGKYSWHCVLCDAFGYGGVAGYGRHYDSSHKTKDRATYMDFLREARTEHKLRGVAAWDWAHSAWAEYEANQ
jgi:hypothetical protein